MLLWMGQMSGLNAESPPTINAKNHAKNHCAARVRHQQCRGGVIFWPTIIYDCGIRSFQMENAEID